MPNIQLDQGVAAIIGAMIGLVGGFIVAGMNYWQKSDELFFKALDYLGGKSQRRNLGISAIELYWGKRRHRDVCISLLSGSAIYLLRESGQGDAAHELHNLYRIMALLLSISKVKKSQEANYKNLKEAVECASAKSPSDGGLIVEAAKLRQWKNELDKLVK